MFVRRLLNRFKGMDDLYQIARKAGWDRFSAFSRVLNPQWRAALRRFDGVPCDSGGTLVDIGANRGVVLALAMLRFAPRRVVAIEPLPHAFLELSRKFEGVPGVSLYPCAVGEKEGQATFYVSRYEAASSLLSMKEDAGRLFERDLGTAQNIVVPVSTLDSIVNEENLSSIDLLKIDVQGYELPVLQGAEETLRRTCVIMTEVAFYFSFR